MTNHSQRRFEPFVRWHTGKINDLLHLSDDKLSAETFWAICQMTNRSQRRFESFVRWQIVPRDVLSRLSDDKSSPETFWDERLPPPQEKWRFESISILEFLLERVFLWIATLTLAMTGENPLRLRLVPSLNFTNSLNPSDSSPIRGAKSARILFGRLAEGKIMDCHADARNDGLGTWVYKSFFTKIVSGGNLSKVFSRARG